MSNTLSAEGYLAFRCLGDPDEYPKSTEQVAVELRSRGFNATVPALNYMIRQRKVQPDREGRNYEWQQEHIEAAAREFGEEGAYNLEGQTFLYLGINADQFYRAFAEAWDKVRDEFGDGVTSIKPSLSDFIMTVHPPRGDQDALVQFTLCDDSRAKLRIDAQMSRGVRGIQMPAESKRRSRK